MRNILYVNPVGSDVVDAKMAETVNAFRSTDVASKIVHLEKGPDHLEFHYYEHVNLAETLDWVRWAEREDYNAVVLGGFYDTGLREAREIAHIPIIGPGEAAMHTAATVGHRFSIVVPRRKVIPKLEDNLRAYGLGEKLASFRSIEFSVPRMRSEPERYRQATLAAVERAVQEDGAEVIVFGSTGFTGFMKRAMEELDVPVLDPVVIAWKWAEMMADLHEKVGLSHCKLFGYETPPEL